MDIDAMVSAYVKCALWSGSCNGSAGHGGCRGEDCDMSLEGCGYSVDDFADGQLTLIREEISDFVRLCAEEGDLLNGIDPEQAGHDLWLTRNGHGAGFWDRGLGQRGDGLTKWAKSFDDAYLTVGDDGLLYHHS